LRALRVALASISVKNTLPTCGKTFDKFSGRFIIVVQALMISFTHWSLYLSASGGPVWLAPLDRLAVVK